MSELYIYQNARCNNKHTFIFYKYDLNVITSVCDDHVFLIEKARRDFFEAVYFTLERAPAVNFHRWFYLYRQ